MLGIDVVQISRIERLSARFGKRGLERFLCQCEIKLCIRHNGYNHARIAGFWAAKEALSNLPLIEGGSKLIAFLKQRGIRCVCFSGGFMWGVESVSKTLGLDAYFANILHHKDDMLSGEVGGYMMFNDSKGIMLKQLQALMGIDEEKTLCVGDGANDISMFKCAKYSVAFCAKDVLKPYASHILDIKDLSQIIKIIE